MNTQFVPSTENKVDDLIYKTPIEGLLFIEHAKFDDERGYYSELAHVPEIERLVGHEFKIKQLNLSHSKQHVVRGIHAENWNRYRLSRHPSPGG
jgi:dTDP-4-dehydrorhamnose 3,5-epimerase-like enzyme